MRRLPMLQKFTLVCLSFLVPIAYLLYTVSGDRREAWNFAAQEQLGVAHLADIQRVLSTASAFRTALLDAAGSGDSAALAQRDAAEKQLDQAEA